MRNHVTGMVVRPETASPVQILRPLLDGVRHQLGLMTVAIVGILVIKHSAVPQTLVWKSPVAVIFMVHMVPKLIVLMGWLLPDFAELITKVCSRIIAP